MNVVTTKPGVEFACIAPGGFVILSAIQRAVTMLSVDLVISSGTDGDHSGPTDPHKEGKAYDVRSHDLTDEKKLIVLGTINAFLGDRFYGFLEDPGTPGEHFHFQVAKGTTYP